ncbi:RNA polymerase sigma factor [Clostridium acetobutylicum]|uniref:RNA polymerase sigma factor SigI n=1 Tax=Clostridium acetobutylicum (strain ATCC 824 / DSM 792 / JCM 1419 / IAM 19013 / LMG 5710 / NBRC 13948 / NRRL B-527 / VKM B-1787 / 2291 / W) TaxID=272562 RepID=Q97I83_CLOAB|nr:MULTISPECIES: RNA polymerase sigma factor SigI [Clostridium]AAK79735.1 RNA polymerase sigma factor, SigK-like [Clostridium acetobutylicum ATCC 824]ADZ20819.1 putative RNA polymerase sigma factor SigI [Clostridium acetobutylicum EA 2018]AEI34176.1 putative RNA polymerase sigma factor SigI [Clostridium acetobutylicum DSM 1731]AWV79830.1 RNA polymerase sigma-I factor [Clostridium acetobutylicum]MBC2394188.1 RNA polymerase sigma factor SigI [Clostridium acetobutylicum]
MLFNRSLEDRIQKAKESKEELNRLIQEYKPFIASLLQKKTGKYLQYGYDDELSIGMIAFEEAVESYDRNKGKFLSFAKRVIILRAIDYYRKNQKFKNIVYLQGNYDSENNDINPIMFNKAMEQYKNKSINEIRRLEILEYKKELREWGIEFVNLVQASPKQEKLKKTYKNIANVIVHNQDILNKLIRVKRLPIKEIEKNIYINRKKLERGRIYIIALVIAEIGDYRLIREYIE